MPIARGDDAVEAGFTKDSDLEVPGYDGAGLGVDGSCQHMTIVWIRRRQPSDQWLETRPRGIGQRLIHQGTGAFDLSPCQIRTFGQQVSRPFLMDQLAPA